MAEPAPGAGLAGIYNARVLAPDLATSGQPDAGELALIAAAGYQTVINLALHEAAYALADEAGTLRALGLDYVHIPVSFEAPTRRDLMRFYAAMDASTGRRRWVHCAANKRVSVFVGLWLHQCRGVPTDAAFALQRDLWQPDAVWARFIDDMLAAPSG